MTDFKSKMDKLFQKKVIGTLEKSVRRVALKVDSILAITTPVDTGRARANWLPSLNVPRSDKKEPGQKESVDSVLSAYKVTDTIYLTNNLPYIERLNEGSSQQAPEGFVEAAVDAGKRAVR